MPSHIEQMLSISGIYHWAKSLKERSFPAISSAWVFQGLKSVPGWLGKVFLPASQGLEGLELFPDARIPGDMHSPPLPQPPALGPPWGCRFIQARIWEIGIIPAADLEFRQVHCCRSSMRGSVYNTLHPKA